MLLKSFNMDNDETSVISKWVADMNLDLHTNHSDPSMELVWLPIKLDEHGNEVIGEGGDTFSFHQLFKSLDEKSSTALGENIFRPVEVQPVIFDQDNARKNVEETPVFNSDTGIIIKNKVEAQISVDSKNNTLEVDANHAQSPVAEVGENNNPQVGQEGEEAQVLAEPEVAAVEEVAVEAQENNNVMGPGRRNWRLMLFLFIVFIIGYQLVDRLIINAWSAPSATEGEQLSVNQLSDIQMKIGE